MCIHNAIKKSKNKLHNMNISVEKKEKKVKKAHLSQANSKKGGGHKLGCKHFLEHIKSKHTKKQADTQNLDTVYFHQLRYDT